MIMKNMYIKEADKAACSLCFANNVVTAIEGVNIPINMITLAVLFISNGGSSSITGRLILNATNPIMGDSAKHHKKRRDRSRNEISEYLSAVGLLVTVVVNLTA